MNGLFQDLRQSFRGLRRDLAFTTVTVLTLAIGVGVNTGVFSVVRSVLLDPLPYAEPDRLVMLWTEIPARGVTEGTSAFANIRDWRTQNRVFEDLATFDPTTLTLTSGEWPEPISAGQISANLFSLLGRSPQIGRSFSQAEEEERAEVVVLGQALWQRLFAGSPGAIGQTIELGGRTLEIVGVMPEGSVVPDTELWVPQTLFTDWEATSANRGSDAWRVLGRLRPGVSLEQARTEMDFIAARLEREYPRENAGLGVRVVPLFEQVTGNSLRLALWTLFGAVGLVLLIAFANAAHLILARGLGRTHEFAVRRALGGSTARLVRLAVAENALISIIAAFVGVALASAGIRLLLIFGPPNFPRLSEISIDDSALAYAAAVSLLGGVIFGTAPLAGVLRDRVGGALGEGRALARRTQRHLARKLLIVLQFAMAIILVFGANLLIRSFLEARHVDPGFRTEDILMANLSVESGDRIAFYDRLVEEVEAIPGVVSVALVEDLVITGGANRPIALEGRSAGEPRLEQFRVDAVAGDFFRTLEVPLREGRTFGPTDRAGSPAVAVINETMARRFWPGESPLGKRFATGDPQAGAGWIEVVGVVGDMLRQGPEVDPIPQVFRPYGQEISRNMNLLIRAEQPIPGLTDALRTRITDLDPSVPLPGVTTVEDTIGRFLWQRRFETFLLGLFSLMALLLAGVGIYGLVHYMVAQRTRELGIRAALGALSDDLMLMVLGQGLRLALPGLAMGLLGALALSPLVSSLLFRVEASDLLNLAITTAVLLATTIAACYLPARRAAKMDPLVAFRNG